MGADTLVCLYLFHVISSVHRVGTFNQPNTLRTSHVAYLLYNVIYQRRYLHREGAQNLLDTSVTSFVVT